LPSFSIVTENTGIAPDNFDSDANRRKSD